ncbi:MAG: hypothetical protein FJZ16_06460 [Candidatus Omnitrophica bacterium]|nr:hypothetical protein [Candidatus Omnitrophota bacterium]
MEISIELADKKDNADLLDLMHEMPMPGYIQVSYRRDPDFFDSLGVEGRISQTIIGRELKTGRPVGMGTRSIKTMYINGQPMDVGYLSSLRVRKEYRGTLHLARGYKMFKELHKDGKAPFYLCTMLNDNIAARRLTTGRAHLPMHRNIGQFKCMAIALSQTIHKRKLEGIAIRHATRNDAPLLMQFLNAEGRRRQFFPVYSEGDLFMRKGLLRDIAPEDIIMAFSDSHLIGVIAAWDQKSFRRSVVTGYSKWLLRLRIAFNSFAKYLGFPILPPVGSVLNYFYLSLVCIRDDNKEVFLNLLTDLMMCKRNKYSFMIAGMHENDPLLTTLKNFRHLDYLSWIYLVYWEDAEKLCNELDSRIPYLELGGL